MAKPPHPCIVVDWPAVANERVPGATGDSFWRTVQLPGLRLRVVEYPPGYLADHWCERAHVLHMLGGALAIELADLPEQLFQTGQTCHLAAGHGHRVRTLGDQAAVVLIVD
ncbi:MAG: DHCW motif cupin fold protein [Kouleothrix sp.]